MADNTKDTRITIRVSDKEYARITKAADLMGLRMSEYIRYCVHNAYQASTLGLGEDNRVNVPSPGFCEAVASRLAKILPFNVVLVGKDYGSATLHRVEPDLLEPIIEAAALEYNQSLSNYDYDRHSFGIDDGVPLDDEVEECLRIVLSDFELGARYKPRGRPQIFVKIPWMNYAVIHLENDGTSITVVEEFAYSSDAMEYAEEQSRKDPTGVWCVYTNTEGAGGWDEEDLHWSSKNFDKEKEE